MKSGNMLNGILKSDHQSAFDLNPISIKPRNAFWARFRKTATLAMLMGFVSACSQVPEALDPSEWYNNTVGAFSDDKPATETAEKTSVDGENALAQDRGKAAPGADEKFPNLASVDVQKKASEQLANGLIADTSGRKRAPAIARQGDAVNPLVAPTAIATLPETAPVPTAVPSVPVVTAQSDPLPAPATAPTVQKQMAPPQAQLAEIPKPSSQLSIATTTQEKAFEKRMAMRLAEIRARANQPAPQLSKPSAPLAPSTTQAFNSFELPTVIISSNGVETGNTLAFNAPLSFTQSIEPITPPAVSTPGVFNPNALPVPGQSTKVATILFGNGSSRLTAKDRRIIAQVSQLAKERGAIIRVVGHASSRTKTVNPIRHKMINFQISVERANSVARELTRLGVKSDGLFIGAVSDQNPEFYEYMPTGEAGNRRTEIYLDS